MGLDIPEGCNAECQETEWQAATGCVWQSAMSAITESRAEEIPMISHAQYKHVSNIKLILFNPQPIHYSSQKQTRQHNKTCVGLHKYPVSQLIRSPADVLHLILSSDHRLIVNFPVT